MKKKTILFALLLMGLAAKTHAQRYVPDSTANILNFYVPKTGDQRVMSYDAVDCKVLQIDVDTVAMVIYFTGCRYDRDSLTGSHFTLIREGTRWHANIGSSLEKIRQKVFDEYMTELIRRLRLSHKEDLQSKG